MHSSDRNLLAGIVALQMDVVSNDQLAAAMKSWANDKSQPLERVFVRDSVIDEATARRIESRVKEQLRLHSESIERSLNLAATAVPSVTPVDRVDHRSRPRESSAEQETIDTSQDLAASTGLGSLGDLADRVRSAAATDADRVPTGDFSRYQVVRPLAKGGLGEVAVAIDDELNREVALKTIQGRYADQTECRNRFTVEAEVTGSLEHPGIVPVYGFGRDEFGKPYYAMRLIRGTSLGEAIKQHYRHKDARPKAEVGLEFRKLIGRFLDVCQAIEYAHSRGILHRDLKPGNIMLGKYGETLVVDWGLAKVLGSTEADRTLEEETLLPVSSDHAHQTMDGAAVGTPMYMSPEQAAGRVAELTARSDIYSLGATLYCLLTGDAPFSGMSARATIASVIDGNLIRPRAIRTSLPKSLEAICLKAMAKEPAERYASASALGDDLERWLADEPVEANHESLLERSGRWLRRHRSMAVSALAASLLIAITSLMAVVMINSYRVSAEESEAKAINDRVAADVARGEALDSLKDAEQARDDAREVSDFLVTALGSPNPYAQGISVTVADVLDDAAIALETRFADTPLTKASMARAIARAYSGLGLYDKAKPLLESALEVQDRLADPEEVQITLTDLALVENRLNESPKRAVELAERAHQLALENDEANSPTTLNAINNLALYQGNLGRHQAAYETFSRLVSIVEGTLNNETLSYRINYAIALRNIGRHSDAISELKVLQGECVATLGPEHPTTLKAILQLALIERQWGSDKEALRLANEMRESFERVYGKEHPLTHSLETTRLSARLESGDLEGLADQTRQLVARRVASLGEEHPHTIDCKRLLARLSVRLGDVNAGTRAYRETHQAYVNRLGPNHPTVLISLAALYEHLDNLERTKEANAVLRQMVDGWIVADSEDTYQARRWETRLIENLRWLGGFEEIVRRAERLTTIQRQTGSGAVNGLAHSLPTYAAALAAVGRVEDAEERLREFNETCADSYGSSWLQGDVNCQRGRLAMQRSEYERAQPLLVDGFALLMKDYPAIPQYARRGAIVARWFGQLTQLCGKLDPALDRAGRLDSAVRLVSNAIGDDPSALAYLEKFAGDRARGLSDLDAAATLYEQSLSNCRKRDQPADSLEWSVLDQLALLETEWSRDPKKALDLSKESWELASKIHGPFHQFTSKSRNGYLLALTNVGRLKEATQGRERLVEDNLRVLGPEHRKTLLSQYNLASVYEQAGLYRRAIDLLESTLVVRRRVFGETHYGTIRSNELLGVCLSADHQFAKAESILKRNLEMLSKTRSDDQMDVLRGKYHVLRNSLLQGRYEPSRGPLEQLVGQYQRTLGETHHQTMRARQLLAFVRERLGQRELAERELQTIYQYQVENLGPSHRYTLDSLDRLAAHYRRTDRPLEEQKALVKLARDWGRIDGGESIKVTFARRKLCSSMRWSGDMDSVLEMAPALIERLSQRNHEKGVALADGAAALAQSGGEEKARESLEQCLQIMQDRSPTWHFAEAQLQLAEILARSNDFERAEELAIKANRGLLANRHHLHSPRVARELIDRSYTRTIELLQRRGATDEAEIWRSRYSEEQASLEKTEEVKDVE